METRSYEEKGVPAPNQYDPSARGLPESKKLIADEAKALGIDASEENVWMADGGMGGLVRTFRGLANHLKNEGVSNPTIVVSSPCFTMARNVAQDNGLTIIDIDSSDLPRQELTPERLGQTLNGQIPNIILITPSDNPTARSLDPENLKALIEKFLELNPDGYFIFDMAYISMIPPEKVQAIINVIKESGAYQRAIFAFSESKKYAIPGIRVGAAVIPNKKLGNIFQADTIRNYPTYSKTIDFEFQARAQLVSQESLEKYLQLLRQRQQTLLDVLRALDPNKEIFEGLKDIAIPGYEGKSPQATTIQDVPLYLWVKLKPGVSAWDLIEKLGIIGVPGEVFGDEGNHMRFSLGVISTSDILNLLPENQRN
ncbi:MAG: pyridoxal phosphate-dependent aminotransferase [Microgenomates group bacterium]